MARVPLFLLLLVQFFQLQVQSSVHDVFVKKGGDVLLEVHNVPQDFFVFIWEVDKNDSRLVTFGSDNKPRISKAYTGRIDFHEDNKYSVILKNLQETDSGLYIARVTTETQQPILAQHNIIVQDVVSPVHLEVNSGSISSHSCNVTLTCITADFNISSTFSCVNQTCDQDGGDQSKTTDSSATLQVYMRNHTVICKHSNQVNSTEDTTDLQDLCPKDPDPPSPDTPHTGVAIAVSVLVFLIIVVVVVAFYCRRRRNSSAHHDVTPCDTFYAQPMVETPNPPDNEEASGTAYDVVGVHGAPPEDQRLPESLYAQIQKHPNA